MKSWIPYMLTACICLFLLGACSSGGDDLPTPDNKEKLVLTTTTYSIGPMGGTLNLSLSSSGAWTASSSQSWCTLSATSGAAGAGSLTITVANNPNEKERTATITVKSGKLTATATVKQAPKEEDKITLGKNTYDVPTAGETYTISLTTNVPWKAASDSDWCKLSVTGGEGGSENISLTVDPNPEPADRTAVITLTAGVATEKITVQQYRKESIVVEKELYEVEAKGRTLTVSVTSNTDYEVTSSASWLDFEKTDDGKLVLDCQKNIATNAREAVIKLLGKYITVSFKVQQSAESAGDGNVDDMPNEDWNS